MKIETWDNIKVVLLGIALGLSFATTVSDSRLKKRIERLEQRLPYHVDPSQWGFTTNTLTISNASEKTITVTFPEKIKEASTAALRATFDAGYTTCRIGMTGETLSNYWKLVEAEWASNLNWRINEAKEAKP